MVVTPIPDAAIDANETVILTLASGLYNIGSPSSATVTIGDCQNGGAILINGAMHCGSILTPGEIDTWTFTATVGDRMAVHIGQIVDNDDFRPWIRLVAPDGTLIGNTSGTDAGAIDGATATLTGTYLVQVASFDSLFDGTGSYRISMAKTPGPITVSGDDQGGPLTNGGMPVGEILQGDLDTWTFSATAGERIALHIGDIADTDDFRPWLRLYAPNGTVVASVSGVNATAMQGLADILAGLRRSLASTPPPLRRVIRFLFCRISG